MHLIFSFLFLCIPIFIAAQTTLTLSGRTYTNSADTWEGVNIPRSAKTNLVFKNNTIASHNRFGYMLQAGDEAPANTNNNLDGAVITGNKLSWTGTDNDVITHGIFTGHNKNVVIMYNYLNYVPMGIIRKSGNNMSNTGGGVAYNIVKGGAVGMVVKGMSNVNIYNNTFYTDRTTSATWRPLVHIYTNTDQGRYSVAHGTRIYNNIFYTKYETPAITITDAESLTGFECDYNVYWCENGNPVFIIDNTRLTFAQWQGRGYDAHSVVMNPAFRDLVNFVPSRRIDTGTNLGSEWQEGLSVSATWGMNDPSATSQNGSWQVGAVIHGSEGGSTGEFEIIQAVINKNSPSIIEMSFSAELSSSIPASSAFSITVNGSVRKVESVSVSGNKLLLTIGVVKPGDKITLDYTIQAVNPVKSLTGEQLNSFSNHIVINNLNAGSSGINIYPNPARHYFNISGTNQDNLPEIIRIYDLAGKLYLDKRFEQEFVYRIQVDLPAGVYILYIEAGAEKEHSQKLVIVK